MSKKAIYVDTSVYLTVLLGEPGCDQFLEKMAGHRLCTSVVMFIEAERNIIRLAREKILKDDEHLGVLQRVRQDVELFMVSDLTLDTAYFGQFPMVTLPKTMDLIHLRAAKFFDDEIGIEGFLSNDKNQLRAAEELGLSII